MASAQELPKDCPKREVVVWEGRRIPLSREAGGWRLRSRSKSFSVDVFFAGGDVAFARRRAREALEAGALKVRTRGPGSSSLRDMAEVYLAMPKRTAEVSARSNVNRLAALVRLAWGKELHEVRVRDMSPDLWIDYQRKRYEQIGRKLDYTQRIPENAGINAAVRGARCLVIPRLRPAYERAGIWLPPHADLVTWLPEPILMRPDADDEGMRRAWADLRESDPPMWLAVGLARFAGLRLSEISACRRSWVVRKDGAISIEIRDRPEERFQHKTGVLYHAPVLHPGLADALWAMGEGPIVMPDATSREKWLDNQPQQWLRPFVGEARKPMHRLRALYASDLAERTRVAVAAQLAGESAAAGALGHTSPRTTRRHYL